MIWCWAMARNSVVLPVPLRPTSPYLLPKAIVTVASCMAKPDQGRSRQIKPDQARSRQIKADQGRSRQIKTDQNRSRQITGNEGTTKHDEGCNEDHQKDNVRKMIWT